jgi:hypothetical protein
MVSALYAVVPPPDPPPPPSTSRKASRWVCHAIDDPTRLYIDPDPVPMPPAPIPLEDAFEHGVSLGGKYVEVYEDDLTPAESQPVLAAERAKLKANVGMMEGHRKCLRFRLVCIFCETEARRGRRLRVKITGEREASGEWFGYATTDKVRSLISPPA